LAKYIVYYQAVVSHGIEVEAEDEAEASEKADREFDGGGLCYHCTTNVGDLSDWFPIEEKWGIEKLDA
jgi:hypothetical protein